MHTHTEIHIESLNKKRAEPNLRVSLFEDGHCTKPTRKKSERPLAGSRVLLLIEGMYRYILFTSIDRGKAKAEWSEKAMCIVSSLG